MRTPDIEGVATRDGPCARPAKYGRRCPAGPSAVSPCSSRGSGVGLCLTDRGDDHLTAHPSGRAGVRGQRLRHFPGSRPAGGGPRPIALAPRSRYDCVAAICPAADQ